MCNGLGSWTRVVEGAWSITVMYGVKINEHVDTNGRKKHGIRLQGHPANHNSACLRLASSAFDSGRTITPTLH